jgi:hypothetical protein
LHPARYANDGAKKMFDIFMMFGLLYCLTLFVGAAINHKQFVDPPTWTGWFWWPAVWRTDFSPKTTRIIVMLSSFGGLLLLLAAWYHTKAAIRFAC